MNKREESFGYRFGMLYRINVSIYKKRIEALGFTPSLISFVAELNHSGKALTQHELSKRLVIDKGACTRALKALEKEGILKRYVNPLKKREKFAELTPDGKKKAKELMEILRESSSVFSRGFSAEDKKKTLEFMDKMMKNGMEALDGK